MTTWDKEVFPSQYYGSNAQSGEKEAQKDILYDALEHFDKTMLSELLEDVKARQKVKAKEAMKNAAFSPGQVAFEAVTPKKKGAQPTVAPVVVLKMNGRTTTCMSFFPVAYFYHGTKYNNKPNHWGVRNWVHSRNIHTEKLMEKIPHGFIVRKTPNLRQSHVKFVEENGLLTPINNRGNSCWACMDDYYNSKVFDNDMLHDIKNKVILCEFSTNHRCGLLTTNKNFDWNEIPEARKLLLRAIKLVIHKNEKDAKPKAELVG